jgi:jumonji domain-containing protein 2
MSGEPEECPVLRPTEEEFQNFEKYIQSLEKQILSYGIARIVPPSSWKARSSGYGMIDDGTLDFPIKNSIVQNPVGAMGIYRQYHGEARRGCTVARLMHDK